MTEDQQRSDSPTLPSQWYPLPLSITKSVSSPVGNLVDNADIPNITPIGTPVISYGSTRPIPIKTERFYQRGTTERTTPYYFTPPNTPSHDLNALPTDDSVFDMTDLIDETNPEDTIPQDTIPQDTIPQDTIPHTGAQYESLDGYRLSSQMLAQEIFDCILQMSDSDFSLFTENAMQDQIQQPMDRPKCNQSQEFECKNASQSA